MTLPEFHRAAAQAARDTLAHARDEAAAAGLVLAAIDQALDETWKTDLVAWVRDQGAARA